MSKICENCGREIPDESGICEECGAFQMSEEERRGAGRLKVKPTVAKIIFAVIVIGALVGLIFLSNDLNRDIYEGGGFESALDNLISFSNGKTSKLKSLAPAGFWEAKKAEGFDIEEYIADAGSETETDDTADVAADTDGFVTETETASETETETGHEAETEKVLKWSYRIVSNEEADEALVGKLDAQVRSLCGSEEPLVTEAYKVDCDFILGDREDGEVEQKRFFIVRIGDNWYPMQGGSFVAGSLIGTDAEENG